MNTMEEKVCYLEKIEGEKLINKIWNPIEKILYNKNVCRYFKICCCRDNCSLNCLNELV